MQETYNQFATLTARAFDNELEKVAATWSDSYRSVYHLHDDFADSSGNQVADNLQDFYAGQIGSFQIIDLMTETVIEGIEPSTATNDASSSPARSMRSAVSS